MGRLDLKDMSRAELKQAIEMDFSRYFEDLTPEQQVDANFERVQGYVYDVLHGSATLNLTERDFENIIIPRVEELSPCLIAIGKVVADVVGLYFQAMGVPQKASNAAGRALESRISAAELNGLQTLILEINQATTEYDQVCAMWSLMLGIKNIVQFSAVMKALQDAMEWYDWLIAGTIITAQLLLWFGTGGTAAAVAEAMMLAAAIAQTLVDTKNAVTTCNRRP